EVEVVVLEEEHAADERLRAASLRDALQDLETVLVVRMRLAAEDDPHRTVAVVEESREPVHVAEEEHRALVGREAPREPDPEGAGIEALEHPPEERRAVAALDEALLERGPHPVEHPPLRLAARTCKRARVARPRDGRIRPRREVDAVRHGRDG